MASLTSSLSSASSVPPAPLRSILKRNLRYLEPGRNEYDSRSGTGTDAVRWTRHAVTLLPTQAYSHRTAGATRSVRFQPPPPSPVRPASPATSAAAPNVSPIASPIVVSAAEPAPDAPDALTEPEHTSVPVPAAEPSATVLTSFAAAHVGVYEWVEFQTPVHAPTLLHVHALSHSGHGPFALVAQVYEDIAATDTKSLVCAMRVQAGLRTAEASSASAAAAAAWQHWPQTHQLRLDLSLQVTDCLDCVTVMQYAVLVVPVCFQAAPGEIWFRNIPLGHGFPLHFLLKWRGGWEPLAASGAAAAAAADVVAAPHPPPPARKWNFFRHCCSGPENHAAHD